MARLVGAVGLVLITAVLYWLLTDPAFTVREDLVSFRGLVNADESEVRALLADIDRGPNAFRVRTSDIVKELSTLPEVDAASAVVTLPASISVTLDERDPVFIWSDRAVSWLVDENGMLFAPVDLSDPALASGEGEAVPTSAAAAARARLPVIADARLPEQPPTEGTYLSRIDLAAMRQLLAVDPELLGSHSRDLRLRVDDRDGYVLESMDLGWRAMFGHYTLTVQPPDVIPAQVQCLQWLLAREEDKLDTAYLVTTDETCGTVRELVDKPEDGS